jgi:hypothetical protein
MQREWSSLAQIGTLSTYGSPFLPYPNGPNTKRHIAPTGFMGGMFSVLGGSATPGAEWRGWEWERPESSPMLAFMFTKFVKNFPGLDTVKDAYWTDQIQAFFDSFAERNLSTTRERSEITKRRLLSMGLTRILGTYYATCITSFSKSPSRPNATILRRMDDLFPGSMEDMWISLHKAPVRYNAFTAIVDVKKVRGKEHFLIASRVLVNRSQPEFLVLRSYDEFQSVLKTLATLDPLDSLRLPLAPLAASDEIPSTRPLLQRYLRSLVIALSAPPPSISSKSKILAGARDELEKFLLSSPEDASASEIDNYMAQADREDKILSQERAEWVKIGKRTKSLRTTWSRYKDSLINGGEAR